MKYCDSCHSSYPVDFTTCPKDQKELPPGPPRYRGGYRGSSSRSTSNGSGSSWKGASRA